MVGAYGSSRPRRRHVRVHEKEPQPLRADRRIAGRSAGRRLGGRPAPNSDAAPTRARAQAAHPRNNDKLFYDGVPWVGRAQDEHDAFAQALRDHGVEVLYLADLLAERLDRSTRAPDHPGRAGRPGSARRCAGRAPAPGGAAPEDLALTLMAGLAHEEMSPVGGLTFTLMDRHDFVVDPLPNLLFTRDSSVWIGQRRDHQPGDAGPHAETSLTRAIYRHHPRFAGTPDRVRAGAGAGRGRRRAPALPRVVAVGVGERTTPASVERLAERCSTRPGEHRPRPCPSPRSERPCTSTRSARWSTSTPW